MLIYCIKLDHALYSINYGSHINMLYAYYLCPVNAGAKNEKRASHSSASPGGWVESKKLGGGRYLFGGTRSGRNVLARRA